MPTSSMTAIATPNDYTKTEWQRRREAPRLANAALSLDPGRNCSGETRKGASREVLLTRLASGA